MDAIVVNQLTRHYGRRRAVSGLSLRVSRGEVLGFLGPNGAGKTTAIRVLVGLLKPTAGQASILNLDCWRRSRQLKRDLGYVPGDLRLYDWMSGETALRIFGAVRDMDLLSPGKSLARRYDLDLEVPSRRMSKGMRQKLGLIMALAADPAVLILDEPTTALDPLMQDAVHQHLRELSQRGITIFLSSHSLAEVQRLCDRVVILRQGRVVADEPMSALRRRATRQVIIHWPDAHRATTIASPPLLDVHDVVGRQWLAGLQGSAPELLRWLAGQQIEDFSLGPPDLDAIFRGYYR